MYIIFWNVGPDFTVMIISHCGCSDPGLVTGLVNIIFQ